MVQSSPTSEHGCTVPSTQCSHRTFILKVGINTYLESFVNSSQPVTFWVLTFPKNAQDKLPLSVSKNITIFKNICSIGGKPDWDEVKGIQGRKAGVPAPNSSFLDFRLLQELHSVSWLPQEPDQCYELLDLKKALFKENRKALQLLHRCVNLCASIIHLVRDSRFLDCKSLLHLNTLPFVKLLLGSRVTWTLQLDRAYCPAQQQQSLH